MWLSDLDRAERQPAPVQRVRSAAVHGLPKYDRNNWRVPARRPTLAVEALVYDAKRRIPFLTSTANHPALLSQARGKDLRDATFEKYGLQAGKDRTTSKTRKSVPVLRSPEVKTNMARRKAEKDCSGSGSAEVRWNEHVERGDFRQVISRGEG